MIVLLLSLFSVGICCFVGLVFGLMDLWMVLSGCMVFGGFWLRGFGCGLFWFGLFFTGRYDGGVYRLLMFVFWVVGRLVLFACWVFACGGLFKLCLVVLAVAVGLGLL